MVCGGTAATSLVRFDAMPVDTSRLFETPESARAVRRAPIDLGMCETCGHLYNLAFVDGLVGYDATYENSQMYSPTFRAFADELIDELAEAASPLADAHVVALGGGRGDFLRALCERTGARGTSYDPSGPAGSSDDGRITYVPEFYEPGSRASRADLAICRHVLEHLWRPDPVTEALRELVDERPSRIYIEVPSGDAMLRDVACWDVIYAHCSYFTRDSLVRYLESRGLGVERCGRLFGDQFLGVLARRDSPSAGELPPRGDVAAALADGERFARATSGELARWRAEFERFRATGERVALWGAGAKSVTFLNAFASDAEISVIADINPRKAGKHVAGTGQQIVPPARLRDHAPDTIVVMNPAYADEIAAACLELGLDAAVVAV